MMDTAAIPTRSPVHAEETAKVWDPFIRTFHWSLVLSFVGAYVLSEDGGTYHQALGYAALGLVVMRIIWGFVASGYARFAGFIPSPTKLFCYLRDVIARREPRYIGHNPAGAIMILALLLAVIATGLTGWMMTTEAFWGAKWLEELHEGVATTTLALAGVHVAGVIFSSIRHRENLVLAMITGRKRK